MSVRTPPFRIGPDSDDSDPVPASVSLTRALAVLAGRDPRVGVLQALRVVGASDIPAKSAVLAEVVRNRALGSDARRRAAILLACANAPESHSVLLEAIGDPDERVRAGAAKGLGWIGNAVAYEPLIALVRTGGMPAAQAEWSARLIAHRHGLAAPELPPLRLGDIVEFTSERRPVRIVAARPERLRLCLESIASRDFLLRFDPSGAREVHCGRTEWMLLLTGDFVRDSAALLRRRSIAASAAFFIEEERSFSIALIVLVEPAGSSGARLIACRSTGEPMFAGTARLDGERVTFSLRALSRPGAFALIFDGAVGAGSLEVTNAASGPVVVPKRRPIPIDIRATVT